MRVADKESGRVFVLWFCVSDGESVELLDACPSSWPTSLDRCPVGSADAVHTWHVTPRKQRRASASTKAEDMCTFTPMRTASTQFTHAGTEAHKYSGQIIPAGFFVHALFRADSVTKGTDESLARSPEAPAADPSFLENISQTSPVTGSLDLGCLFCSVNNHDYG